MITETRTVEGHISNAGGFGTLGNRAAYGSGGGGIARALEARGHRFLHRGRRDQDARAVGRAIAERAKAAGVESVAFDRSGFRYHGRVKALAEAAREAGLKF